ncbi:uncharacterized vacuolar membrane protein YML018C-like isoform X2 [Salvia miltiorrhiza]|nr:uncharacterized vacuolar membrane protein YML018C-like isoform X2 [Salvia miltiorrhiza]
MVIYLPISFLKEWMCNCVKRRSPESPLKYIGGSNRESFSRKDSDLDLSQHEEGIALVSEHGDAARVIRYKNEFAMKHIAIYGFYMAPLWFITEYLSNAALLRTSVASTTVLSSTSGLFTLMIGAFLGEDSINVAKVVSVLVSILGVVMTTLGGTWASDDDLQLDSSSRGTLVGDLLGLLSAVTYGLFTVLLKKISGHEERRVQKLFGYIGLSTLVSLWWLVWPLRALGVEPESTFPTSAKVAKLVVANGLIGSVLSDYCWALSVVWTTPLVATLGMSLTIPVAMLADMIIHGRHYSLIYIIGSIQVFAGFVIANLSDWL